MYEYEWFLATLHLYTTYMVDFVSGYWQYESNLLASNASDYVLS